MSDGPENRRAARRPIQVEIQVGDTSLGAQMRFDSGNVSEGGVFIKSELLLEVGEILWVSFVLPDAAIAIRTRGRVVWVNKDPDPDDPESMAGMGVQFMDLSAAERAALTEALEGPA